MFTMADAKDDREAACLFKLAADQGDASAQVSLGNLAKLAILSGAKIESLSLWIE
jgi:TPR repeat protein